MGVVFEVPTSNQPQTQTVALGGVFYQLTTRWNAESGCWTLDIADSSGIPLLSGLPMITGADLLAQFEYLGIANNGALVVQSDNNPDLVPDSSTLGATGHLFCVVPS